MIRSYRLRRHPCRIRRHPAQSDVFVGACGRRRPSPPRRRRSGDETGDSGLFGDLCDVSFVSTNKCEFSFMFLAAAAAANRKKYPDSPL